MFDIKQRSKQVAAPNVSLSMQKTQADTIEQVIVELHREGIKNVSGKELRQALLHRRQLSMDPNEISRALKQLEVANRIVRDRDNQRACSVTGMLISPVFVPAQQVRLFA